MKVGAGLTGFLDSLFGATVATAFNNIHILSPQRGRRTMGLNRHSQTQTCSNQFCLIMERVG